MVLHSRTDAVPGNSVDMAPKNWTIEGSNDDTNWTILDTQVNQIGWVLSTPRFYNFTNETSYLYYRINVSASVSGGLVGIGMLNLYYTPPANPPYYAFDDSDFQVGIQGPIHSRGLAKDRIS